MMAAELPDSSTSPSKASVMGRFFKSAGSGRHSPTTKAAAEELSATTSGSEKRKSR